MRRAGPARPCQLAGREAASGRAGAPGGGPRAARRASAGVHFAPIGNHAAGGPLTGSFGSGVRHQASAIGQFRLFAASSGFYHCHRLRLSGRQHSPARPLLPPGAACCLLLRMGSSTVYRARPVTLPVATHIGSGGRRRRAIARHSPPSRATPGAAAFQAFISRLPLPLHAALIRRAGHNQRNRLSFDNDVQQVK